MKPTTPRLRRSGWINVKDRLPDKETQLLITFADGRISTQSGFKNGGFFDWVECGCSDEIIRPSHWMDWPEEPTEDK